jgi:hypothetical protein
VKGVEGVIGIPNEARVPLSTKASPNDQIKAQNTNPERQAEAIVDCRKHGQSKRATEGPGFAGRSALIHDSADWVPKRSRFTTMPDDSAR